MLLNTYIWIKPYLISASKDTVGVGGPNRTVSTQVNLYAGLLRKLSGTIPRTKSHTRTRSGINRF